MKKTLLISLAILALQAPPAGHGEPRSYSVLLAGGTEPNVISVWLTPDGKSYVIDSIVALEVGGSICTHPEGNENELVCPAPMINGFEVNAGGGDDSVSVAANVPVPVKMRAGEGNDILRGGAGPDRLYGSAGDDRLAGGRGDDHLNGGPGNDVVFGGPGDDVLMRGPGNDALRGGPGDDEFRDPTKAAAGPQVRR